MGIVAKSWLEIISRFHSDKCVGKVVKISFRCEGRIPITLRAFFISNCLNYEQNVMGCDILSVRKVTLEM